MTTTPNEAPVLEQRHWDALQYVTDLLSRKYVMEPSRSQEICELPAILRALVAENARLKTEKDELLRALKLSGGVARKALEELAAHAPAVGDGMVLVPRHPTKAMIDAAVNDESGDQNTWYGIHKAGYYAMIRAATKEPCNGE
jgi:hypothetical protein